jgi:hypothetical protein
MHGVEVIPRTRQPRILQIDRDGARSTGDAMKPVFHEDGSIFG